jgi:prepilin-type N-terminal cleavage/methylation domain-containing protein
VTRSRTRHPAADSGFSLLEVMVTMAVMSVVTALFTTGIVQIYSATNNNEALTVATQQIHNAFLRLDRDIRYASGISIEGTGTTGGKYVEYAVTNTGTAVCGQLRVTTAGLLQTRSKTGTAAASAWSTLASGLVFAASSLTRSPASSGGSPYQQLNVSLLATSGAGKSAQSDAVGFSFTALNTSTLTSSDTGCRSLGRP